MWRTPILFFIGLQFVGNACGLELGFEPDRTWKKNRFQFSKDVWNKGESQIVVERDSNFFIPSARRMDAKAIKQLEQDRRKSLSHFGFKGWSIAHYEIKKIDQRDDAFWLILYGSYQKDGERHFVERFLYSPKESVRISLLSPVKLSKGRLNELKQFIVLSR